MKLKTLLLTLLLSTSLINTSYADFQDGLDAAIKGDYKTALKEWQPLADQGYAKAQTNLGLMYYNGEEGVLQDYKQAVKWWQKAADQGDASAQGKLGVMYRQGKGVLKDDKQAVKWYTEAAEQGYSPAQYNLGQIYREGKIVLKDDKKAVKWYTKAAEQGHYKAQFNLAGFFIEGRGVFKDLAKGMYWTKKSYENPKSSDEVKERAKGNWNKHKLWEYSEIVFFDKDSGFYFPNKISDFVYRYKRDYSDKELGYSLRYHGEYEGEWADVYVYTLGAKGIQNGIDGPLILKSHRQAYGDVQQAVQYGTYVSFLDIKDIKFPLDFLNNNFSYIDTRNDRGRQRSYLFSRGQNGYFVKVRASALESGENSKLFEDKLNKFLKQLLLIVTENSLE